MLLKPLCLLFVLAHFSNAKLVWPFYTEPVGYRPMFNASVGTPVVDIILQLQDSVTYEASLQLASNRAGGVYDPDASSTFRKLGDIDDGVSKGRFGIDTFVIAGTTLRAKPLSVIDNSLLPEFGAFSLSRTTGFNSVSFVEEVVKGMDERIAVMEYDEIKRTVLTGSLTLGGKPDDCSTKWTRIKEVKDDDDKAVEWAVNLDSISVGKYQFSNPGVAWISTVDSGLDFPESTYDKFAKILGADKNDNINCDTNITITFTIGGIDFEVGPEIYIRPGTSGTCLYNAGIHYESYDYALPVDIMKNYCNLFDFSTREIGFAKRLK